jgi:hypothetical protein
LLQFLPALFPLAILVLPPSFLSGFSIFLPAPAALVDFKCAELLMLRLLWLWCCFSFGF